MSLLGRRRGGPTVALAGAGSIATVHALAAAAAGCRVAAVASARGTTARHLAGQLDARRCRPADLPAGADLLVVATPASHHVELALQGLAAGSAVLVEKPLATTLAGADRLVDTAAAPGAPILRCAENLVHAPAWGELVRRRPALGSLTHCSARAVQPPPTWGHFAQPLTAGGVLFDLGPHPVALVLEAAGSPPVGVAAALRSGRVDGADDHAEVRLRFADGLAATVEVSWASPDTEWSLQLASDSGVLRWELFPTVGLEADGEPVPVPDRHSGLADPRLERLGYVDQLADLAASAGGAQRPGQTAEQARAVLEVITAAYASAGAGGDEVPLPFTGDRDRTPLQWWRGGAG